MYAQEENVLQTKIDKYLESKDFDHASISISVIDIESGDLLAGVNPDMSVIPASSLKILTTLSGIELLGEDFQFETKIRYDGVLSEDGTLKGNIYIEGGGDPTFGSARFKQEMAFEKLMERMAQSIVKKGITCVEGMIIADESIFSSFPISPSWQWNDLGNYYATGAWGVNINENQYSIIFNKRGVVGKRPKLVYHYPYIPELEFSNEVVVDSSHTGDQAYIFGGPYNYYKRIVGTIPQGKTNFTIKGSIPDPPLFAAFLLSEELNQLGIQTEGYETLIHADRKANQRKDIVKVESPFLEEIARKANFESNNLYCESILKSTGLKKRGQASGQNGIAAIRGLLRKYKIDHGSLNMEDGSGLSARNNVSSQLLAEFLQKYCNDNGTETTCSYLPKAGAQGTVRGLLRSSKARGKVWMKSGSMNRVTSYTGIMQDASNNWKTFSVIINGYTVKGSAMRSRVEKIIDYIYKY